VIVPAEVDAALQRARLLPVLVIDDAGDAIDVADALRDGGVSVVEVTCRTPAAVDAIRRLRAARPEMLVGAGTVLTVGLAAEVIAAGAQFVVAPSFNAAVVEYCQSYSCAVYPGVATPTEIEVAMRNDLRVLKLFPAEILGGPALIDAVGAVYPEVQFIPTGGIRRGHLRRYFATNRVIACGGGWMVKPEWIRERQFDRVRDEVVQSLAQIAATDEQ
jgi:2-dehydro-3-deoxyphosphogluconate aldolase / (4S)-4-hydroxy-2-oxoglutarate aldolase